MNNNVLLGQPMKRCANPPLGLHTEATEHPSVSKCQRFRRAVIRFLYRSQNKTVNKYPSSRANRLPSKCQMSNALKYQNKTVHRFPSKKQSRYPNKVVSRFLRSTARVFLLSKQSCSQEGFLRRFVAMEGQVVEEVVEVDIMVGQEGEEDTMENKSN